MPAKLKQTNIKQTISTNECSDVYAGPSSASELESRAVMAHINGQLKRWDAFLSFHSYGNWWYVYESI